MHTVVTLGELLIDFVPEENGLPLAAVPAFRKAPGGAPANVAAAVAKLGGRARFVGKVGDDPFGWFLRAVLEETGVDTRSLLLAPDAKTTLAFARFAPMGSATSSSTAIRAPTHCFPRRSWTVPGWMTRRSFISGRCRCRRSRRAAPHGRWLNGRGSGGSSSVTIPTCVPLCGRRMRQCARKRRRLWPWPTW